MRFRRQDPKKYARPSVQNSLVCGPMRVQAVRACPPHLSAAGRYDPSASAPGVPCTFSCVPLHVLLQVTAGRYPLTFSCMAVPTRSSWRSSPSPRAAATARCGRRALGPRRVAAGSAWRDSRTPSAWSKIQIRQLRGEARRGGRCSRKPRHGSILHPCPVDVTSLPASAPRSGCRRGPLGRRRPGQRGIRPPGAPTYLAPQTPSMAGCAGAKGAPSRVRMQCRAWGERGARDEEVDHPPNTTWLLQRPHPPRAPDAPWLLLARPWEARRRGRRRPRRAPDETQPVASSCLGSMLKPPAIVPGGAAQEVLPPLLQEVGTLARGADVRVHVDAHDEQAFRQAHFDVPDAHPALESLQEPRPQIFRNGRARHRRPDSS